MTKFNTTLHHCLCSVAHLWDGAGATARALAASCLLSLFANLATKAGLAAGAVAARSLLNAMHLCSLPSVVHSGTT